MRWTASRLMIALLAAGMLAVGNQSAAGGPAPRVIVLGNSIAAGCCVPTEQQWGTIFADQLGNGLNNIGVGGATSTSLINQDLTWPSGRTQPQLDEGVSLLGEAAPGSVTAVTLDIGGNDLLGLTDPDSGIPCIVLVTPACDVLVAAAVVVLQANLHTIMTSLLAAMEPSTRFLVMTYYNPLDDGGELGDLIEPGVMAMNDVILAEIAEHGATHVDVHAYFADRSVELISGDNIHPSKAGHALLADIFTNAVPPDSDGDGLSDVMEALLGANPAVQDSDSDGCTDGQEFGPDKYQGGLRNAVYFWDFFDVWTHPVGQPTVWVRDKVVNVPGDIIGVVSRFGPGTVQSKEDALAAALTPPVSDSGYHAAFDRGPVLGPNNWDRAPPDGAINVPDDIFGVALQFGHSCE